MDKVGEMLLDALGFELADVDARAISRNRAQALHTAPDGNRQVTAPRIGCRVPRAAVVSQGRQT